MRVKILKEISFQECYQYLCSLLKVQSDLICTEHLITVTIVTTSGQTYEYVQVPAIVKVPRVSLFGLLTKKEKVYKYIGAGMQSRDVMGISKTRGAYNRWFANCVTIAMTSSLR